MKAFLFCWLVAGIASAQQEKSRSAEDQNRLGESLEKAGELNASRKAFEQAIALKPAYGSAHLNLGVVLLELNQSGAAALHLDRAVQILGQTPEAGYALFLRARIYSAQNEPRKAAAALTEAVKLRPDLAEAWSDLGVVRKSLQDTSGTLAAFKRAVDLAPDDPIARYRLGAEYLRGGQTHLAVQNLEAANRLRSGDQSTLNSLQTALRQDNQLEKADQIKLELSELLVKKDEASQNALAAVKMNNEGAHLEKAGDLRGALEKYREAHRLYPEHVGIRVNFAVALLRTGHWTDGLNELHEAHLREPGNAQIKEALMDALKQAPPGLAPDGSAAW